MPEHFTCQIEVLLHASPSTIMTTAAQWGWTPLTFNEAVAEILLWSDAPAEHGIQVIAT